MRPYRPTKDQLQAARGLTIPDVLAPGLRVLFCGINPSLYSAAIGHHFGRPGNRFWPSLHQSGFTARLYSPFEDQQLLECGLGITNVAAPATATAEELSTEELIEGGKALKQRVLDAQPAYLAVLGISAYRVAFHQKHAVFGLQQEQLGPTRLWVLPNPSGLNAHYRLEDLARLFAELREAVGQA